MTQQPIYSDRKTDLFIRIATAERLIDYQTKVREDRRWQFEQWDKNSVALIYQYNTEIADAKAKLELMGVKS